MTENPESKWCFQIPGQLLWLVPHGQANSNDFCWVFYSRKRHKLKCKCSSPHTPGMLIPIVHYTYVYLVHLGHVKLVTSSLVSGESLEQHISASVPKNKHNNFPLSSQVFSFNLLDKVHAKLAVQTLENLPHEVHPETELLPSLCPCSSPWQDNDQLL